MKWRLLRAPIEREDDIVSVRQRARTIAERLGFSRQDQTGLATAVSEIARNAYGYGGGGFAQYGLDEEGDRQSLVIEIADTGRGIADVTRILEGRYVSPTGMGLGIVGARRLVDTFAIRSTPGTGTTVALGKYLPPGRKLNGKDVTKLSGELARERSSEPQEALRDQNRELMQSLADLAEKEEETRRLNADLQHARDELEARVLARTTELAEANDRLRQEAIERARIEGELRQAQKMKAVGQLTGGLAHDFNNLLTGISGSLDLLKAHLLKGRTDRVERYIEMALSSTQKAGALTHRLLAFSRPQALAPQSTDANTVVRGMEELLRRTITDVIAFRVSTSLDLWPTLCDAHELENAILNLCINARDAMPDGGTLVIETANEHLDANDIAAHPSARAGDHVRVTVADTGSGMTPEVVARVFEPFFTTKPVGEGTGLGLAMIYGFARQSKGFVEIDSNVGSGTRITLHLPRHVEFARLGERQPRPSDPTELSNSVDGGVHQFTILLVEQNAIVRDLTVEVLLEDGHCVLLAEDGPGAMRLLGEERRVDLLVTDLGLPGGMSGRKLAEDAQMTVLGLKVLFITGYIDKANAQAISILPGAEVLPKPFQPDALNARVWRMLAGRRRS